MDDPVPVTAHEGRTEPSLVPVAGFRIERHRPKPFREPYHQHASVEVNFLNGMEMTYAFADRQVVVPDRTLTVFWAIAPHRVVKVEGTGTITNLYIPIAQILRRGPRGAFMSDLFHGGVLSARPSRWDDAAWLDRMLIEQRQPDPAWQRLHLNELDARLTRMALEGWTTPLPPSATDLHADLSLRTLTQVERMLRFVADSFAADIAVPDVVAQTDLSQSHAAALFRRFAGQSIKLHIDRTRLSHAWTLLAETDLKIATVAMDSGFRSLSRFYDAMARHYGRTPGDIRRAARLVRSARP